MASTAYCLYCFEILAASFENRDALSLHKIEDLWAQYQSSNGSTQAEDEGEVLYTEDVEMTEDEEDQEQDEEDGDPDDVPTVHLSLPLRSKDVSRLQVPSPAPTSSSSTPSTLSATSSQAALGESSKSSSKSSFFSFARKSESSLPKAEEEHSLFVTWNTISSRGYKSLRGCIGTFEAQPLSEGLRSYALTSYE